MPYSEDFSDETHKKIQWVTKMYHEWRSFRQLHSQQLQWIECDLDDASTISEESLVLALTRFLTEVKKIDGTDFPAKTLYEILICVQFQLEKMGFVWKLLNHEVFKDVKFILDNLMKLRTAQGIGRSVKKAEVLMSFDEELLWSHGLLRTLNLQFC